MEKIMFKNMTVGKKIAAGFTLMIVLAVLIGGVGTWKASEVEVDVKDLNETHLPLTLLMGKVAETAGDQDLAATMFVLHGEERFVADFNRLDELEDGYFQELTAHITADQDLVSGGWLAMIEKLAGQHDEFVQAAQKMMAAARAQDQVLIDSAADLLEKDAQVFKKSVADFNDINTNEAKAVAGAALAASQSSKVEMGILSVVILLVGSVLAYLLTRAITKPLSQAINDINEGATQVAVASGQVSSASQSLAEGASEQAASLEETSSSLEELTAMTRQNAENAAQANVLMQEATVVGGRANASMAELTSAMKEVTRASEDTSKIIKTIDEIAFQTNLLALNAAVEAARAGEAGAGFAVVAAEVRNLAMRAAEAAKNTSNLIEGTLKRVQESSVLVGSTNEAFAGVSLSSAKVSQLIAEIAAASKEQSLGVDQISTAVTEMDQVTQQNAAAAEESASASEELSSQAEVMRDTVADLAALIGGNAAFLANGPLVSSQRVLPRRRQVSVPRRNTLTAQLAIPFADDEEFVDFQGAV
ncbi:MAG: hypothetical protein KKD73_11315 [Proteobacteria bacterium]|nr:hypothetical protein [Pseudomonadota bacterium]MBU1641471.1 hypothetical protein [Pseudomonadota bacterium]